MRLFKRITAAMIAAMLAGTTVCYAEYEFGNLKKFHSFEDYDVVYNTTSGVLDPAGFVTVSSTFNGRKGYYIDEARQSKTFKMNGYNTEACLKFGTIVDSGMMHLSYDVYQDYDDSDPMSKGKSMIVQLARTSGGNFSEGWYHGETVSGTSYYYGQYDPEAINHNTDAYQSILNLGQIEEHSDDADPIPYTKGPISYYNAAKSFGTTESYDPDAVIDWRQWYKIDIYFDKDNNTYEVYLNGELVEGQKYDASTGTYGEALAATLDASDPYKAIKGVFFRAKTATYHGLSTRPNAWHKRDGGFFLLDNVYVKSYTGDKDIISLVTDDLSGEGVALSGGTLNVAYSEYMQDAASKENISIENTLTGEQITDFEISNSDNMQFLINFGDSVLAPGQYKITVSGITGKISGEEVALPGYFNTVSDGNSWVSNVTCLRSNGTPQERGIAVTSGTTAIAIEFTEAIASTSEEVLNCISLKNSNQSVNIDRCEISDDCKTVIIYPEYLLEPDSEYVLEIADGISASDGGIFNLNDNGNILEETIAVANDPRCDYTQEFTYDSDTGTAEFAVDIIKSDWSKIKYTMVVASYADAEDEEGNTIPQLIDIQYIPVSIDEDERALKSYTINSIDCTGANRVKAFIWDYPSFENIYAYEETIE